MKKTYIKPATLQTAIGVQQMICESTPRVTINSSGSVGAGSVESRRGSSVWDEDEDYE